MHDPLLTGDGERPERRPADEAGRSAERQGFDHIAAAPHAAVEQYRNASGDGLDDRRQDVERRRRAIELAAAVIGYDDPVDSVLDSLLRFRRVEHTFEDE